MKRNLNTNDAGFTLLESLITLLLTSIILMLFTGVLAQLNRMNQLIIGDAQAVSTAKEKIYGSRQIEWHIFLVQLEKYLENTTLVEINRNQLIVIEKDSLTETGNKVRYGQAQSGYKNFGRRNNNGYHELLTAIRKCEMAVNGNCLKLFVVFQNGEEYTGRIWVDDWQEKES